jgi:hypothetical protein
MLEVLEVLEVKVFGVVEELEARCPWRVVIRAIYLFRI